MKCWNDAGIEDAEVENPDVYELPLVGVLSEKKVARHAVISAQLFLINGNLVLSSERNFPKFWMASMN